MKRRRSTAEPELGAPRRRRVQKQVEAVAEESEPEEVEVPVRKVSRNVGVRKVFPFPVSMTDNLENSPEQLELRLVELPMSSLRKT